MAGRAFASPLGRGVRGARGASTPAVPWVVRRRPPDYVLFALVATLVVFGLIVVYSASYAFAAFEFDDPNYFIRRQAMWALLGMGIMLVFMNIDYRWLRYLALPLIAMTIVLLAAVLAIGDSVNGAQRWLTFGPFGGQPSELAKFAVLIYMSAWLVAKGETVRDLQMGVAPFLAIVALVGGLVMAEPDLGTTLMIAAITGTLFFVAQSRLSHVLLLGMGTLLAGGVLILASDYRLDRITSFTSAEADPSGLGFQTLQLLVAFGSGGVWGLGLGVSRQKFLYVPGSHTDGIMAIIGEELGFVGVVMVLILFAGVIWRAAWIAHRAPDKFGSLLATGIIAWLGFQLLINVAGVTRMIPLTGIPLPFLSYGGSALAATMAAVGVLLSISRYAALDAPEEPLRGAVPAAIDRPARGSRGGR
ncbi:MAG: putative lipid II flippase FtsW [Dehalococcoidia bacterium]|nr:putative lipid II flippase FtsW [Dehalococcoidia bacterium]